MKRSIVKKNNTDNFPVKKQKLSVNKSQRITLNLEVIIRRKNIKQLENECRFWEEKYFKLKVHGENIELKGQNEIKFLIDKIIPLNLSDILRLENSRDIEELIDLYFSMAYKNLKLQEKVLNYIKYIKERISELQFNS